MGKMGMKTLEMVYSNCFTWLFVVCGYVRDLVKTCMHTSLSDMNYSTPDHAIMDIV